MFDLKFEPSNRPLSKESALKKRRFIFFIAFILTLTFISAGAFFIAKSKGENKNSQEKIGISSASELSLKEVVYGYSVFSKEIKGYEIGSGEKSILFFGAIHGNEMGSNDLLERLTIEIKQHPEKVSKNIKLIIIPILNPDGFYDRIDKLNANGVNLNLNFETADWQQYGPEGTYAGSAPFSEPESRIIRDIVEKNNVVQMISFHSQGALSVPENNQPSIDLAKWYAEKTGYTYSDTDTSEYFGYNYFGTATGWFAGKTGNAAITVELTDHFSSDWDINKSALMELALSEK